MLMHGAKRQFIERLQALGIDYRENKNEGWLYVHAFNAEILFATLESESRVRGPNFDWGWGDEIEYLTDLNVWRAFKGAVRSGDNPQLFVTSTPKGRRLIWQEWVRDRDANHTLHKATTHDNPFIDAQDYVAGLGYTGRFAAQEIGAEFVSYEGLVYERFDRDIARTNAGHRWMARRPGCGYREPQSDGRFLPSTSPETTAYTYLTRCTDATSAAPTSSQPSETKPIG